MRGFEMRLTLLSSDVVQGSRGVLVGEGVEERR